MKRFLVAASFAVLTYPAFALPSIDAVQAEIGKGSAFWFSVWLGLAEGDRAAVSTTRGSVVLPVLIDDKLLPGQVVRPYEGGAAAEAPAAAEDTTE